MEYREIKSIADSVIKEIKPYCERAEIAGSIRRKALVCNDIEIIIIPAIADLRNLMDIVHKWHKVKGEITGRYTQRILPGGVKLDLFMATRDNWGLQYAIRTGAAEFSHKILAAGWKRKGYKSIGGVLYPLLPHTGDECGEEPVDYSQPKFIREEIDLFRLIGIEYLKPELRI